MEGLERTVSRSIELHAATALLLTDGDRDVSVASAYGNDVAINSATLSMEHADSLLALMAHGNPSTATAVSRMQFEAMLRSDWAIYAAAPEDIEVLEQELSVEADASARKVGVYGRMLQSLRAPNCRVPRLLLTELGRIDDVLRHSLNSFVHGGFQALKWHAEGVPKSLAIQVIETSNAIFTMSAALLAILLSDDAMTLAKLNSVIVQFRDVLPEITLVQALK